ncbi:hypothetical protein CPB86DRAFT_779258 [Serendipita vermifera]|nr:hypothetical protein CPB86DRAFT_779258 [Serendipita vermifera]
MDPKPEENDLDIRAQARRVIEDINAAQRGSSNTIDLSNLYTQYNSLVDEAERQKCMKIIDRFSVLPVELIHQIFHECCRDSTDGPLILSSVSSRWFKLVCSFPDIWTRITINTNEPNWRGRLKAHAQRSGDRLLDVTLCFPLTSEEVEIITKSGCLPRWRSLNVIDTRSDKEKGTWTFLHRLTEPQDLLQLFRFDDFPELRHIDIRVKSPYTREPCLWSSIFFNAPVLQNLSISPVLLSNLTINLIFIEFSALLALLAENPGLVSIKLSSQRRLFPLVANYPDKIPLHRLENLISEDMVDVLAILQHIDCPNLKKLQLRCATDKLPPLMDHVLPLHHLKTLILKISGPTEIEFLPKGKFSRSPSNLCNLHIEYNVADVAPQHRMSSAISQIASFFPTVKVAKIITDNNNTNWRNILSRFMDLEELTIQYDINRKAFYAEDRTAPLVSRANVVLPKLWKLRIRGDVVREILRGLNAPNLTLLSIEDTKSFDLYSHLSLPVRFPAVHTLQFEALCPESTLKELEQRPTKQDPSPSSSIEELITMHDSYPLLEHMNLSNVRTLRLNGVRQEFGMKRENLHFTPRSIDLSIFLKTPQNKLLLERITFLDLAFSSHLFPAITGLEEALPSLVSLERISFPRALFDSGIPVDILISAMIEKTACPRLVEIHTEDYPLWDPLMQLLTIRNRTLHLEPAPTPTTIPKPIECLYYPGLLHPSRLEPLQMALAGKFPKPSPSPDRLEEKSCDDCVLSGWECLRRDTDKESKVRSQCSRHKSGPVRISAYS